MHEYTHAIVGKIRPALRVTDKADFNDARRQHDCYLRLLRELGVEVVEVQLDGPFPSNAIVEDAAIVCHGIALLPKPSDKISEEKVTYRAFFTICTFFVTNLSIYIIFEQFVDVG